MEFFFLSRNADHGGGKVAFSAIGVSGTGKEDKDKDSVCSEQVVKVVSIQIMEGENGMETNGAVNVPAGGQTPLAAVLPPVVMGLPPVKEMIDHVIEALPQLGEYRAQLETVTTLAMLYTGDVLGVRLNTLGVPRATALEQLSLTRRWTLDNISTALESLAEGIGVALKQIEEEFAADTGVRVTMPDKLTDQPFTEQLKREQEEQKKYVDWAHRLLAEVERICLALGIPNVVAQEMPQPSVAGLAAKKSWFAGIGQMAVVSRLRGTIASYTEWVPPVSQEEGTSVSSSPAGPPSWLTEPVLKEDDADLKIFQTSVMAYLPYVSSHGAQMVLNYLGLLGINPEGLSQLLKRVVDKARKQLAQSEQILQNVARDKEEHSRQILALANVENMVRSVTDFFMPEEAKG